MQFPVVDYRHTAVCQQLRQMIPDGYHVVGFIQCAEGCRFFVGFSFHLGIALGCVGVQDQHRRLRRRQIPMQRLFDQSALIVSETGTVFELDFFRIRCAENGLGFRFLRLGGRHRPEGKFRHCRFVGKNLQNFRRWRKPDDSSGF